MTTSPFVASDTESGVLGFVSRVRSQHGADIPVGYRALTRCNAIKALKAAWERSGEVSAQAALAGLRGLTSESPTGPVSVDPDSQHATMNIVVARGGKAGLQLVKRLGAIVPAPGCRI